MRLGVCESSCVDSDPCELLLLCQNIARRLDNGIHNDAIASVIYDGFWQAELMSWLLSKLSKPDMLELSLCLPDCTILFMHSCFMIYWNYSLQVILSPEVWYAQTHYNYLSISPLHSGAKTITLFIIYMLAMKVWDTNLNTAAVEDIWEWLLNIVQLLP